MGERQTIITDRELIQLIDVEGRIGRPVNQRDYATGVSRAAYLGWQLGAGSFTVEDTARALGIGIAPHSGDNRSALGRLQTDRVPSEERLRFSYGTLPDELIRAAENLVALSVPEIMSVDLAKRTAGTTMQIVQDERQIGLKSLRARLASTEGLFPAELSRPNILALDNVARLTHDLAVEYFATKQLVKSGAEALNG